MAKIRKDIMRIVGIDPGFSGGVALIENQKIIDCFRMPILKIKKNKKIQKKINGSILGRYLTENNVEYAIFELVSARPDQGTVSMFNFGKGVGIVEGVLQALDIPYKEVSPQTWKKLILGEQYDHTEKTGTIQFCQDNYPSANLIASKRSSVAHNGIADAICIGLSYYKLL